LHSQEETPELFNTSVKLLQRHLVEIEFHYANDLHKQVFETGGDPIPARGSKAQSKHVECSTINPDLHWQVKVLLSQTAFEVHSQPKEDENPTPLTLRV
jgi:hypothetical protein